MTTEAVEFGVPSEDSSAAQTRFHYVSRVGISKEEVKDTYRTWASQYDKDSDRVGYNGPNFGAELLFETLGTHLDARILDAASGTGLGGKIIKDLGYKNVDALDASKEMLDVSKQHQCYTNYIEATLDKSKLPVESNTYDMVITYGSFVPGHVNDECFAQLARIIKPGGFFGLVMCERYFHENPEYAGRIEPHMQELEQAGVWKHLRRDIIPNYHGEYKGVKFVLQLQPNKDDALTKHGLC